MNRILLLVLLCFFPLVAGIAPDVVVPKPGQRIVAVGDIHGDYNALVSILKKAGLVDEQRNWTGGDTIFVQTGDMTDRGPDVRKVFDLLMALEEQAPAQGGQVHVLLGNHETMNLSLFMRDVGRESYAAFAGENAEKLRKKAYNAFKRLRRKSDTVMGLQAPHFSKAFEKEWYERRPLGYLEYIDAISPDGVYGKWLRGKNAVLRVGHTVFVHGGIDPDAYGEDWTEAEVNKNLRADIAAFDAFRAAMIEAGSITPYDDISEMLGSAQRHLENPKRDPRGNRMRLSAKERAYNETLLAFIKFQTEMTQLNSKKALWFRGFADWHETNDLAKVETLVKRDEVRHFVAGHTPQGQGIAMRFGGRIILVDTGMLHSHYGGQPAALEIIDTTFRAIYLDRTEVLLRDAAPAGEPRLVGEGPIESIIPPVPAIWTGVGVLTNGKVAMEKTPDHERTYITKDGNPQPFRGDNQVLQLLREAEIGRFKELGSGKTLPRRAEMRHNGVHFRAIFRTVDSGGEFKRGVANRVNDHYGYEVAAYHLSRLMGLYRVPPVVLRDHGGRQGSFQFWIENGMTETVRLEKGVAIPDEDRFYLQDQSMRVFDALIQNLDRNQGNFLFDHNWNLWYIDHTRAFDRNPTLRDAKNIHRCDRTFFKNLQEVGDDQIAELLAPFLKKSEIRSLLKRRAKLVRHLEKKIAKKGEAAVLYDLKWVD
ncbi:metallophosphoesterase [Acanthopleuribacter pedis]|uniref:Metallophosphoesterase n=1 Tax=Acanthopleuribacter pedis TaxID=442870 RepID=A0A8J7Q8F0_9BACT|nr:metallophosphoesterase [Acanthopleuribacter pedis]MBO1318784.1 metallophosphoesterase [Acanthopleuribacter pedis]